jgi:hypothetical protein
MLSFYMIDQSLLDVFAVVLLMLVLLSVLVVFLIFVIKPSGKGLIKDTKNYISTWRDPKIRSQRLSTAAVWFILISILVFVTELWNEYGEMALGVGIVALYGIWKIAKWVLFAIAIYWIGKAILEFLAERIAYHVKRKDDSEY